jgi:hypothetical protein
MASLDHRSRRPGYAVAMEAESGVGSLGSGPGRLVADALIRILFA